MTMIIMTPKVAVVARTYGVALAYGVLSIMSKRVEGGAVKIFPSSDWDCATARSISGI